LSKACNEDKSTEGRKQRKDSRQAGGYRADETFNNNREWWFTTMTTTKHETARQPPLLSKQRILDQLMAAMFL
jgi:hypothetical protein